jgi:hypothetical protein
VNSGGVASGQIGQYHLASGAIIAYAQVNAPFLSGSFGQTLASEMISGVRAVAIDPNGRVRIAMAAVSGRMPAVGVVTDNILSGMPVSLLGDGPVQFTSGMNDYSGFVGRFVFVGRSGTVSQVSGSWSSGGWLSGDIGQTLGTIWNSGGVLLRPSPVTLSGGPIGIPMGPVF